MKRTALRPRSKTSLRSLRLKIYAKRKTEYLALAEGCEICKCNPYSELDLHHRAGRNGSSLNEEGEVENNIINMHTFMALCRPCHDRVHRNPKWAREMGYLV